MTKHTRSVDEPCEFALPLPSILPSSVPLSFSSNDIRIKNSGENFPLFLFIEDLYNAHNRNLNYLCSKELKLNLTLSFFFQTSLFVDFHYQSEYSHLKKENEQVKLIGKFD